MTIPQDSQQFESYVPVYDAIPDTFDQSKSFIVEQLKKISDGVNIREIGWFLDEELLTGKQFIPGSINSDASQTGQNYRSILRKVVDVGPLVAGLNVGILHGILFDFNFTLIDIWVAGTNSTTLTARDINPNDVLMTATQIIITSPQAFDRAFCVIEYIQEL